MTAVYPATLASINATKQDDTDTKSGSDLGISTTTGDHAAHHNQLAEELVATQTELGTDPSGTFSTVSARLNARLTCRKTADQATTSATPANVTDLTLPVATTGLDYYYKFVIPWFTSSGGVVCQFGVTTPAVTGYNVAWFENVGSSTVPTTGGINVVWDETVNNSTADDTGGYLGGTAIPATNIITITQITGILSNPSATGSIVVRFRTETAATSVTAKRGAYGELYVN